MITEKQKEAVKELCQYVDNFCKETAPPETANNNFRELLDVLREKDSTIREMAEEIGMLKQTITQLKQDKSGRVSDASDSTVANAI